MPVIDEDDRIKSRIAHLTNNSIITKNRHTSRFESHQLCCSRRITNSIQNIPFQCCFDMDTISCHRIFAAYATIYQMPHSRTKCFMAPMCPIGILAMSLIRRPQLVTYKHVRRKQLRFMTTGHNKSNYDNVSFVHSIQTTVLLSLHPYQSHHPVTIHIFLLPTPLLTVVLSTSFIGLFLRKNNNMPRTQNIILSTLLFQILMTTFYAFIFFLIIIFYLKPRPRLGLLALVQQPKLNHQQNQNQPVAFPRHPSTKSWAHSEFLINTPCTQTTIPLTSKSFEISTINTPISPNNPSSTRNLAVKHTNLQTHYLSNYYKSTSNIHHLNCIRSYLPLYLLIYVLATCVVRIETCTRRDVQKVSPLSPAARLAIDIELFNSTASIPAPPPPSLSDSTTTTETKYDDLHRSSPPPAEDIKHISNINLPSKSTESSTSTKLDISQHCVVTKKFPSPCIDGLICRNNTCQCPLSQPTCKKAYDRENVTEKVVKSSISGGIAVSLIAALTIMFGVYLIVQRKKRSHQRKLDTLTQNKKLRLLLQNSGYNDDPLNSQRFHNDHHSDNLYTLNPILKTFSSSPHSSWVLSGAPQKLLKISPHSDESKNFNKNPFQLLPTDVAKTSQIQTNDTKLYSFSSNSNDIMLNDVNTYGNAKIQNGEMDDLYARFLPTSLDAEYLKLKQPSNTPLGDHSRQSYREADDITPEDFTESMPNYISNFTNRPPFKASFEELLHCIAHINYKIKSSKDDATEQK